MTHRFSLARRLAAEGLGTALLLATVVGSGIMAERLAGGNVAIALLGNTVATGAMLVVLITLFGPISGAHFNTVVSVMAALRRDLSAGAAAGYVLVQLIGGIAGVVVAHLMFGHAPLEMSTHLRSDGGLVLSEGVATFGLIATILGVSRFRPDVTAVAVGLYITGAYWFTASTSFANPAVTVARSLTESFSGIAPASVPAFIAAQFAGMLTAVALFHWLLTEEAAP